MAARAVIRAIRWALLGAILLTISAMLLYPGGTSLNRDVRGYSFFHNSLSDLGATVSWNGVPNRGSLLEIFASLALVVAGALSVVVVIPAYSATTLSRAFARAAGAVLLVSSVALIGLALAPEDRAPVLHGRFTLIAVGSFPLATLLLSAASAICRRFPRRVWLAWFGLTTVVVAWLSAMSIQPETDLTLAIPVTLQKVVAVCGIGTLLFQVHEVERLG
jgi:hypothetical membrane protein